ncbi:cupin [Vallitalea longa]|uniref:Cupin n=1 Tax=Vallitalea longa TaxID=2936439 RepID=A0A9W6DF98_9FIRM|nr:cupin [Vallitalea longa]
MNVYDAEYFIDKLELIPHVEGGYYRELYKNTKQTSDRSLSTTIYYLLKSGQVSKFHKLTSDEIWFYHYGAPLTIHMITSNGEYCNSILGLDIEKNQQPQIIVPAGTIFGAEITDNDTFGLVSCMVSPGFDFNDFHMYTSDELIEEYPMHENIIRTLNG